jgi:hypothetical protein
VKKILLSLLVTISTAGLIACGGGNSSSATPAASNVSTNTFPVGTGITALAAAGQLNNFNVSGTCNGTFSNISAPANTSTTFEGNPALSSVAVITISLSNCTGSSVATETSYYSTSYLPLGFSVLGGNFGDYAIPPVIPATVHVGDAGVVGTENLYTNSAKTTPVGRNDISYAIEPDTSTSAILNLISKNYNVASTLQNTVQDRYRMQANGSLTLISSDVLYSSGTHLILN